MIYTNAFNNLQAVLEESGYNIFRYNFDAGDFTVSVFYTHNAGMMNQITLRIVGNHTDVVFPVYFVPAGEGYDVNTYIDPEFFGLLVDFFSQYQVDGRISTTAFFTNLRTRIENMGVGNLVPQNVRQFGEAINTGHRVENNYNLPFFQTLVHAHMGREMRAKIRRICSDADEIIAFLDDIEHTLRFTDDPTLARDLYIVLAAEGYEAP